MEWRWCNRETHPHLSRLSDISLGLEQFADVQGLSAPEVPVDAPVEGELEGPPVEASAAASVSARKRRGGRGFGVQDVYLGAHDGDDPSSAGCGGREKRGSWPQCLAVVADGLVRAA